MRFIAFDLETTGTLPGVDQIVEIGAVLFDEQGQPETIFATLIQPTISMPPAASRVNGITDDMLVGKPRITDVLDAFADFCGDEILVAHNAPFDAQFLTADIKKFESTAPTGVILDTCNIARKVYPGLANYKLGTLVQHLNIPATGFHRAEEDAGYCGQLFSKMIARLSQHGPPSIATLVNLTSKPELRFPQIEKSPKQVGLFELGV
ncbi:MAG: 3'-5' exonuclease [Bdellovibrionales bacterium]|jgi:DNA polymerase-3 subunit epsilon|nr:3'-5' exonuclease [Bdellovibrionales bacterium]